MKLMPFSMILKNGKSVLIREVTPEDRALLQKGYAQLSNQSKYFRFLSVRHDLSVAELDRFTVTNGPDHIAIGALAQGGFKPEPVGIARFVRLPDQIPSAEIALTIVDSHQNLGLGTLLLGALAKFAQVHEISEFVALVHRENTPMLHLLRQLGGTQVMLGGAEIEVRTPVVQAPTRSGASSVGDAFTRAFKLADIGHADALQQQRLHPLEHWANLFQFAPFQPKTSEFFDADQSVSVWVDDGGAIV